MIDLLVINYNTKDKLERFVDTLLSDAGIAERWRLYIADNGSTDGSQEYMRQLPERVYEELVFNENVGYALAANDLVARSNSPYFAILNADTWMTSLDVECMLEIMMQTGFEIMGPKQRDEVGKIRHAGIHGTNQTPSLRGWGYWDPDDTLFPDTTEMVSVSGSAYFMKRSAWDELSACPIYKQIAPNAKGAFLPTQMYYEETWCSYHARAHGMKVVYTGMVSIGHTWAASSNRDNTDLYPVKEQSREFFRMACQIHGISCD